jgi:hypothetical protein
MSNNSDVDVGEEHVKSSYFTIAQIIFIALMSGANVVLSLLVSPIFKALFTHVIAGVFIMVPINFIFFVITKNLVNKFGTLGLYFLIYGVLAIPTPLFGGVAGVYKVVVGVAIGLVLDVLFLPKNKIVRMITVAFGGSLFWWTVVYSIWQLFDLPFVTAFSNLMNGTFDLSAIITIPITGFGVDFFLFAFICGLFSAGPDFIATILADMTSNKIKKTAVYSRFQGTN